MAHCTKFGIKLTHPVGACNRNLNVSALVLTEAQEDDAYQQGHTSGQHKKGFTTFSQIQTQLKCSSITSQIKA